MVTTQRYNIPEIGEVIINKNRRATRVRISVKPGPEVKISLPYSTPYEKGLQYILEKKEWVLKTIKSFEDVREDFMIFTSETEYHTRFHTLVIKPHPGERLDYEIQGGTTLVNVPEKAIMEKQVQDWIKKAIEETWRMEAKIFLIQRTMIWIEKYKFLVNKISIRNSKTRWGSCSSTGNINLSLHLMKLPTELIDFVILHELTHTIHKNHGPKFHELLDKICGGKEKELNARLRAYKMDDYRMYYQIMK